MSKPRLRILGTRGIPAAHGGFETFAEHLALYLVGKGWEVTVYCQMDGTGPLREEMWRGVQLVYIPVDRAGAVGTMVFDWKSTLHAARERALTLTLGYNTAAFCAVYRLRGVPNVINMDGVEWRRQKWSWGERTWLFINERLGCWLGNHLIADHPEIKAHLATRVHEDKISMIPYGADEITGTDSDIVSQYGLAPGRYALVIARPEPENSILEIVQAFSTQTRRVRLVMLGNYDAERSDYHRAVLEAASSGVVFLGAIYDKQVVQALRYHAFLYIHGHQVGGTNPSLVEALGAGCAVLAHSNPFNRWVAGSGAQYFSDQPECKEKLDKLLADPSICLQMKEASKIRFDEEFRWGEILAKYEKLLLRWVMD